MDTTTNPRSAPADPLDDIGSRACLEFNDVLDFVWKSPHLIEHETKVELQKITSYFPNNPELQKKRWSLESAKLRHTFPYMIAVGNLFSVLSLFESYLLLLAGELQSRTGKAISEEKGQGASKLFNYLKSAGITPTRVPLYEQVQAATMVRNCLMHASGMLSWSRDNSELRRLQASGSYLSPEHRQIRNMNGGLFDEMSVTASALGDRLTITNEYPWVVCVYLRDYFVALCAEVKEVLQGSVQK